MLSNYSASLLGSRLGDASTLLPSTSLIPSTSLLGSSIPGSLGTSVPATSLPGTSIPGTSTFSAPPCTDYTATPCVPCYFGGSSTLLSFPYTIETITVKVEPHVTVYPGGSSVINFSTTTLTEFISNVTASANATSTAEPSIVTFTDDSQLTWSTLGTVLTAPTTYAQYLEFTGAAPAVALSTSSSAQTCADYDDQTAIQLPSTVNNASLIAPLPTTSRTWPYPIPSPILQYLGNLSTVEAQMGYNSLASCAPLTKPSPLPPSCVTSQITTSTVLNCSASHGISSCFPKLTVTTVTATVPLPASSPAATQISATSAAPAYSSAVQTTAITHKSARSLTTEFAPTSYTTVSGGGGSSGGSSAQPDQLPPNLGPVSLPPDGSGGDTTTTPPPTPGNSQGGTSPSPGGGDQGGSGAGQSQNPPQPGVTSTRQPDDTNHNGSGFQTGGSGSGSGGSESGGTGSNGSGSNSSGSNGGSSGSGSNGGGSNGGGSGGSESGGSGSNGGGSSGSGSSGGGSNGSGSSGNGSNGGGSSGSGSGESGSGGSGSGENGSGSNGASGSGVPPNGGQQGQSGGGSSQDALSILIPALITAVNGPGQTTGAATPSTTPIGDYVAGGLSGTGITVSLLSGGLAIVVDGTTQTIASGPNAAGTSPVVTVGSSVYTQLGGGYVIGGQTLQPGSAITIPGSSGSMNTGKMVIGSVTVNAVASGSEIVIGSQTLTAGGAAQTIDGQLVSAGSNGASIVIGTGTAAVTEAVPGAGTTATGTTGSGTIGSGTAASTGSVTSMQNAGPSVSTQSNFAGRINSVGLVTAAVSLLGLGLVIM